MTRIICLGIAVLDQVYTVENLPAKSGKYFANNYLEVGGGPAATAAVTIAKLGGEVEFWGRVGDDGVGERIVDELKTFGVNTTQVRKIKGAHSAVSAVLVDQQGERLIVNRSNPGLDPDPSWLPLDHLQNCDGVLVDSRWIPAASALLKAAQERGIPSLLDGDSTPNDNIFALVQAASHTVFSQNGLFEVSQEPDFNKALLTMDHRVDGWIGATQGEKGTFWVEESTIKQQSACQVEVVDTLGAGDVFHGAFVFGLAKGWPIQRIIRFASVTAALKCRQLGGRAGIPNFNEVNAFLGEEESWN